MRRQRRHEPGLPPPCGRCFRFLAVLRMIEFLCTNCGAGLRVRNELAGARAKCPRCKQMIESPRDSLSEADANVAAGKPASSKVKAKASAGPPDMEETELSSADAIIASSGGLFESDAVHTDKDLAFLDPPQQPGELGRVGPYRILRILGSGGMGIVFEAEDVTLLRPVALKSLKADLAAKDEDRKRFLREAQTAAAIDHEHIVTIYQVGEHHGIPYLAMKLLRGESLESRLNARGGRLPFAEVVRIGQEVAEGLAAAHKRGLIHRDIKPANIWLEEGRDWVRLVDFGLARVATEDTHLTQTGMIIGTPAYMAPEQANAEALDHRCDLFSLGCLLYRMSTGQLPFKGKNTMAMLLALAAKTPPAPHTINPSLPVTFSALLMQLLEKNPDDRPSSAQDVWEALEEIKKHAPDDERALTPGSSGKATAPITPNRFPKPRTTPPPVRRVEEEKEVVVEELETVGESSSRTARTKRRSDARRKKRTQSRAHEEILERKVMKLAIIVAILLFCLVLFLIGRYLIWKRWVHTEESQRPHIRQPFVIVLPSCSPRLAAVPSVHDQLDACEMG
jgi:serine/threonine protein kinase